MVDAWNECDCRLMLWGQKNMQMNIRKGGLAEPETIALLRAHLEEMKRLSPPGSIHALDLQELSAANIDFWTVWSHAELLGCGALKALDKGHCEIKSMHTANGHRGKGVGAEILSFLIEEARRRGFYRISLETGSVGAFAPARALYSRFGFVVCGPFADYRHDPHSIYMTMDIENTPIRTSD